jgi:hypothetical protein
MDLFKAVLAASRKPPTGEIFEWLEYSEGKPVDFASLAVSGTRHARLDARLAAALSRLITGELKRRCTQLEEEQMVRCRLPLTGRQYYRLIKDHLKTSPAIWWG